MKGVRRLQMKRMGDQQAPGWTVAGRLGEPQGVLRSLLLGLAKAKRVGVGDERDKNQSWN